MPIVFVIALLVDKFGRIDNYIIFYIKNSKIQMIASPTKSVSTIDFDNKATKIAIRAAKILGLFKTIEFS